MKFAFSSNAFRNYSLEACANAISRAGFKGIEIMCDTPHAWPNDLSEDRIDFIKQMLCEKGLTISNLNAFMMCAIKDFHHPSWIEKDKAFREIRIEYTRQCIDLAARLGVATISTEPGGPPNGLERSIALEIFMEGLARVAPYAVQKGITILIEPEPGLLIENSEQFLNFITKFNQPGLGLNFDVGHFYCVGEDPVKAIELLKKYIYHFHLEDIPLSRKHQHILLGQGGIDITGVLEQIKKIDYQGFVTVELYPYQDTAAQTAILANNFLRENGYNQN